MGKRELLLIIGFIFFGVIVYQATAPDAGPGSRGISLTSALEHVRREIAGNKANAEVTSTRTIPVNSATSELRIESFSRGQLSIMGEDRDDIGCELRVWSNGYDDAEAHQLAEETHLVVGDAAASLVIEIKYPQPGHQRASLTLKVPSRLAVRIQSSWSGIDIANVAAADLVDGRGKVSVASIAGRVSATHRGGELTIEDAASVKLETRGSDVRLRRVTGGVEIAIQAGELQAWDLSGPIELESSAAALTFERLTSARGPIRINASSGRLRVLGLSSDARIDGRNTAIEVALDKPAAIAIYNQGTRDTEVVPPAGGFQLDAVATNGRISLPDGLLEITTTENGQRSSGAIRGGGPTVTLRASRGDIIVRARDGAKTD